MSIDDWMRMIATSHVADLDLDDDEAAEDFLRHVVEVGNRPTELLTPLGESLNGFMTTLAWATREAVLEFNPPFELRQEVVHGLPDILHSARELGSSDEVFGFWDVFLVPWELRLTWHFSPDVDRALPIIEDVKDALIRQIGMSNDECLQQSALHGINHLKDEATAERARAFEATFSVATREYSLSALAFRAL